MGVLGCGEGQGRVCWTEAELVLMWGQVVGTVAGVGGGGEGGFQHWCRVGCLEPDADAES